MTAWSDLVATALVGTERHPLPPALAADLATALGADLPAAPPELSVLTAAGVLTAYRRAGWIPPRHDDPAPDPAPSDDRPLAPAAASQLLELLLNGEVIVPGGAGFLAAEWLDRCASAERRLPERLLPHLLAAATGDRSLRAGTVAAGGPRLHWLASRNPDWAWAATADVDAGEVLPTGDDATVWATGESDARMGLFAALRATRPDDARVLAEETWSGEIARDRAAIVAALSTGLGPGDEPFLEAALDDRAKAVRGTAAELLAALPSSRMAARMADRLRPLVTAGGRLRKYLEVALPEEPDPAARRDGIVDAGGPPRTGPRAWWLTQMVAATPLAIWEDHLGLDPATVVRLANSREVRHGLVLAARRQGSPRWAAALLAHHPTPSLLAVLPPAEADVALGRLLGTTTDAQVGALLDATPGPWSVATSRAVLTRLRVAKTTGALQYALAVLATRLHPAVTGDIERWATDLGDDDHARRFVRGLARALSIRQTIARELT